MSGAPINGLANFVILNKIGTMLRILIMLCFDFGTSWPLKIVELKIIAMIIKWINTINLQGTERYKGRGDIFKIIIIITSAENCKISGWYHENDLDWHNRVLTQMTIPDWLNLSTTDWLDIPALVDYHTMMCSKIQKTQLPNEDSVSLGIEVIGSFVNVLHLERCPSSEFFT